MAQFDYQGVKADKEMKPVKFLVSGWNVQPDGSYRPFKEFCDYEQAQGYLHFAIMRNSEIAIKVDNIEVIWNAE